MMEQYVGVLRVKDTRRGQEHRVEFTNKKGKQLSFVVNPGARHYANGADGDEAHIEVDGPVIKKCVIPGKKADPPVAVSSQPQSGGKSPQGTGSQPNVFKGGGYGANKVIYGTSPYNFVCYKPGLIVPPDSGVKCWSGTLRLRLTALTPLLVGSVHGGKDDKAGQRAREGGSTVCRFLRINGQPVIPGSSIKGMLRSLVEILSYSGLRPMNKRPLFWRKVNDKDGYGSKFPADKLQGGLLRRQGATFTVTEVTVTKGAPFPKDKTTLGIDTGPRVKPKTPNYYYFNAPTGDDKTLDVAKEVVEALWDQATEAQKKRLDEKRMASSPGLPVFYITDAAGNITELGVCRYFRLKYERTPFELAWPSKEEEKNTEDMARSIFGHVGDNNLRGRVSVEPCTLQGEELAPGEGVKVVLGGPKPTCVGYYLCQNPKHIHLMRNNTKKNDPGSLTNYDKPDAKLRGRKLYWHHKPDAKKFPKGNDNEKVMTCLHPLKEGAGGEVTIHVRQLTDVELGALLEALELRPGCAHKLGMGRPLGYGSVKLELLEAQVQKEGAKYDSLASRLGSGAATGLDAAQRQTLRQHFRQYVFQAVRAAKGAGAASDYDHLDAIKQLFIMLGWQKQPLSDEMLYPPLSAPAGDIGGPVTYADYPILPEPAQIRRAPVKG